MKPLHKIHAQLAPLRRSLLEHPIYARIDRLESLDAFMQHHVFAVWDFMSLLKTLQQRLCHTHVPWLPPMNRRGCRLVNEIVLAEESDEDGEGSYASHFELYHRAMQRCGADTSPIDQFLDELRTGNSVQQALVNAAPRMPFEISFYKPSTSSTPATCALLLRPLLLVGKTSGRTYSARS